MVEQPATKSKHKASCCEFYKVDKNYSMDTDCVIHFKDRVLTEENKREFTQVMLKKFLEVFQN